MLIFRCHGQLSAGTPSPAVTCPSMPQHPPDRSIWKEQKIKSSHLDVCQLWALPFASHSMLHVVGGVACGSLFSCRIKWHSWATLCLLSRQRADEPTSRRANEPSSQQTNELTRKPTAGRAAFKFALTPVAVSWRTMSAGFDYAQVAIGLFKVLQAQLIVFPPPPPPFLPVHVCEWPCAQCALFLQCLWSESNAAWI